MTQRSSQPPSPERAAGQRGAGQGASEQRVSARVGAIEESATLAISAKAKELAARGEQVIGFGAGEPDFPTPARAVEAAARAAADPDNHRYSPAGGRPELKEAIAAATERGSGLSVAPSQVLVTNGAKQAVYETFATLLDPGDEVLLTAPYWVTYPEAIKLAGGVPVPVETGPEAGFRATVEQLDAAVTPRTKVLLFVSPSNPTGAVYPRSEIRDLGRWAAERGLWVVTDEIYEHLVYGDHEFSSLPVEAPELDDRWVVINGVSKTYAMTGWRVGWMIGPADVIAAASNLQSHLTSNVSNVSQAAALAALSDGLEGVDAMREAFDRRRRTMVSMLSDIDGVECAEPGGAFYAFPSLRGLLGHDLGGATADSTIELAGLLLDTIRVAIVPGEAFGAPGYARLSYALADDDLVEGVGRIASLVAGETRS